MSDARDRDRIVVDTTAHVGGGAITYFRNVLPALADEAYELVVLVPPERCALTEIEVSGVSFRTVGFPVGNILTRECYRQILLPMLLARLDSDLLFSPADVTSLLAPCPTVVMVQNLFPYMEHLGMSAPTTERARHSVHRLLTRLSLRVSTTAIYVSEFVQQTVTSTFGRPDDDGVVIHHGIDHRQFVSKGRQEGGRKHSRQEKPYILVVSTVNRHKNFETLFRAFATLETLLPTEYRLLIAGRQPDEAYFEKLTQLAAAHGIDDRVEFLGKVPHESLPPLYANASVYVLPSLLESFGLTVLEAMACETPVVATDTTAIPEVCGDAARLFDPESPDSLADALQAVLTDDDEVERLVRNGRRRVKSFSWSETSAETKALMKQALEQDHR